MHFVLLIYPGQLAVVKWKGIGGKIANEIIHNAILTFWACESRIRNLFGAACGPS